MTEYCYFRINYWIIDYLLIITHYSLLITYLYLLLTILITYIYIYLFIYYLLFYIYYLFIYYFIYIFIYRMFCTSSTDNKMVRDMSNSENGIVYAFSFYTICDFALTLVSIDYWLLNTWPGISWRCKIGSAMGPGCLDLLLRQQGRDYHPRRKNQMGEATGQPGGHLSRDQPKRQQHPASSST